MQQPLTTSFSEPSLTEHHNNNNSTKSNRPLSFEEAEVQNASVAISPIFEVEDNFCSNFACCGRALADLHELLEHYEECHVRVEESDDEQHHQTANVNTTAISEHQQQQHSQHSQQSPQRNNDQGGNTLNTPSVSITQVDGTVSFTDAHSDSDASSSTASGSQRPKKRRHLSIGIEPSGFREDMSAFDNTIIRRSIPYLPAPFPTKKPSLSSLPQSLTAQTSAAFSASSMMAAHAHFAQTRSASTPSISGTIPEELASLSARLAMTPTPDERFNVVCNLLAGNLADSEGIHSAGNGEQRLTYISSPLLMMNPSSKSSSTSIDERPYICPVPGCDKSYKNPNGLKYHALHGHDPNNSANRNDEDKPYRCTVLACGKRYKNPNGLKYHITHSHANMNIKAAISPRNLTFKL